MQMSLMIVQNVWHICIISYFDTQLYNLDIRFHKLFYQIACLELNVDTQNGNVDVEGLYSYVFTDSDPCIDHCEALPAPCFYCLFSCILNGVLTTPPNVGGTFLEAITD